eukprot:CAMPEP_0194444412 /NCGR_PEP_ID=MMETSP0176-20130528/127256_1 /TAXON_ID=216777 /ORGANISM="Proboscia alata, Strain PI-D3" /LENGTH=656 /DNA_ID=CAMNT_0039270785 /DNA_START=179 /DNA_END=2148 /DNA_ORIENTATION=-
MTSSGGSISGIEPAHSNAHSVTNDNTAIREHNKPQTQSGIFGASSNLINSIVGAGIIGIPYAFNLSGLLTGWFLLILVGMLTRKSLTMIVETATFHPLLRELKVDTFETLAGYPFGDAGSKFILWNMLIMAYGAMVAYLVIIKDTVPSLFGISNDDDVNVYFERECILVVTSVCIMVPLSMQRDMATLAFTTGLSVSADVILVVFVACYAPVKSSIDDAGGLTAILTEDMVKPSLFMGLGILSVAMACQHSAFIVSGSLHNLTPTRWGTVTGGSLTASTLLCLILGSAGYIGFMDETQGDVLNNFGNEAQVARALLAITMFFTYPMESFVGRHVLASILYRGDLEGSSEACVGRRKKLTLVLYIAALIPALIFDNLGHVLSVTGSLGGSCIAYIAPGLVYLGVNGEYFLTYCNEVLLGATPQEEAEIGANILPNGTGVNFADDAPSSPFKATKETLSNDDVSWGAAYHYGEYFLTYCNEVLLGATPQEEAEIGANILSNGTGVNFADDAPFPSSPFKATKETLSNDDVSWGAHTTPELPVEGKHRVLVTPYTSAIHDGSKPFWWYLLGFPIWVAFANHGMIHTKESIQMQTFGSGRVVADSGRSGGGNSGGRSGGDGDFTPPTGWDYFVAVFFVLFGLVAAVAGLAANIVEITKNN